MTYVLDATIPPRPCRRCQYRKRCLALALAGLPLLCERVTAQEQRVYQHRGEWGAVLLSRVEARG